MLGLPSRSAFIREAVRERVEQLEETGILEFREVSTKRAIQLIDAHLQENPGTHYVSDLVERLGLEPAVAFAAAQKLIDRGRARLGRD